MTRAEAAAATGDQSGDNPGEAPVRVDVDGAVATVRFGEPPLNLLTRQVKAALEEHFCGALLDPSIRAIVLAGAGESAFSAGADLKEFPERVRRGNAAAVARQGHRLLRAIRSCGRPVVAAVSGHAYGAGLELALAADLRVAGGSARFALPEATRGVFPGNGGTQTLSRLVGPSAAKRLMMLGSTIEAAEALRLGLIDAVEADATVLTAAQAMAAELAQRPALALRHIKHLVDTGLEMPLASALELEAELFGEIFSGPDVAEGVAAFLERRVPRFTSPHPMPHHRSATTKGSM